MRVSRRLKETMDNKPKSKAARTTIRGVGWKKATTIAVDKYAVVSKAVLAVLPTEPIRFTELVERVAKRLPDFDGSVAWYTITCARELEVQGRLRRHPQPVGYSKPAAHSGADTMKSGKNVGKTVGKAAAKKAGRRAGSKASGGKRSRTAGGRDG